MKTIFCGLIVAACVVAGVSSPVIIPKPAHVELQEGKKEKGVVFSSSLEIKAGLGLENEVKFLSELGARFAKGEKTLVELKIDKELPKEGYELDIEGGKITIEGGSAAGVFYGIQSLKQMLPAEVYDVRLKNLIGPVKLEAIELKDAPLTGWRGLMLDSARHFQPKEFILKLIDSMAAYKLNRLHWHMVDSEAWRLEIKKYPKLVEVTKDAPSEYPSEDPTDKSRPARYMYGHFHGGGHYTQEDVKEIVAYAKARHIEVMPEIEFPAHAMAAFTAYPEYSISKKVPTVRSNHSPDLIGVDEESLDFLRNILDEVMELFPFEMIHFGGDEAPKGQWKESPVAQAKMKELGLKDENELQAWVFNQMADHIAKKGKRPAGWEEIMHGTNMESLNKQAVIMAWLSRGNAIKSAQNGYSFIHTSVGPFYLDSWQTDSPADNWALYRGPLTLKSIYTYDLFGGLTPEIEDKMLGAQCQMWSELLPKTEHMEYQLFPRLLSLAELTWTPLESKNYDDFYKRLIEHRSRLDAMRLNYRYIDPLPIGVWNVDILKTGNTIMADLTENDLVNGSTESVVEFKYEDGPSGLEVEKVELLKDGKVLATDEHIGKAATKENTEANSYRLKYPAVDHAKGGKYQLKVTHKGKGQNSQGAFRIYSDERGLELFNPKNFAGGDYPSATWSKSDVKSGKAEVRVCIDGLVKEPGDYELILSKKDGGDSAIKGVQCKGSAGVTSTHKVDALMNKDHETVYIPLMMEEKDVTPGSSIYLALQAKEPSSGELRVRPKKTMETADKSGELKLAQDAISFWNPKLIEKSPVICYLPNVKAKKDGELSLVFNYLSGGNGLDVKEVQVLQNGAAIAEEKKAVFTGGNSRNVEVKLSSPKIKSGESYTIRLNIAGAGGVDSHGEIKQL